MSSSEMLSYLKSLSDNEGLTIRTVQRYIVDLEIYFGCIFSRVPKSTDSRVKVYKMDYNGGLGLSESEFLTVVLAAGLLKPIAPNLSDILLKLVGQDEKEKTRTDILDVYFPGLTLEIGDLEPKIIKILQAIRRRQKLVLNDLTVLPARLLLHEGKWVVMGELLTKSGNLTQSWRLDQIHILEPVDQLAGGAPSYRKNPSYGLNPTTKNPQTVLIRMHNGRGQKYLNNEQWHPSQKILSEDQVAKTMDVQFEVNDLRYFKFFVRRWLPHAEVLSPDSYRDEIQSELEQAIRTYKPQETIP